MLAFTMGIAVLTAILFGFAPAWRASAVRPNQALKEIARGAISRASRFHPGKAVVIVQVALSLVLLVGAGLFLGTLRNLLATDMGFSTHGVLLVTVSFPQAQFASGQRLPLFGRILDRLRAIPGVGSASYSSTTPIQNWFWNEFVYPEGYTPKSDNDTLVYFNREFFGHANPIGKTINLDKPDLQHGNRGDSYSVIGVVKDIKYRRLDESPLKTGYVSSAQDPEPGSEVQFEIRSDTALQSLTPAVQAGIAEISSGVSLEFRSFETQVSDSLLQPRLIALLSTSFGILALVLAMVGLYGLTSYRVARRRGEIGLRIALGAQRQRLS